MRRSTPLPGFKLSLGYSIIYLSFIVFIPLVTLLLRSVSMDWLEFVAIVTAPRAFYSYAISFGGAMIAATINCIFGTIIAWSLVKYRFFGSRLIDSLIDLPFAIPTAVSGIALSAVWSPKGIVGQWFSKLDIHTAYSRLGIVIAMIFVGLPFVVRTVQPVISTMNNEMVEAAETLGATRFQIFFRIILPHLSPAVITGFALCFARALGEYGSIVFISGNMPMCTEITPLLIMTKLEQFDYKGATALSMIMLISSLLILFGINSLHWRFSHKVKLKNISQQQDQHYV